MRADSWSTDEMAMADWVPDRAPGRRRTVFYAVGAAITVLLFVAGFVFVNSASVSRVTDNARALHWNNSSLGVSALTRAGLAQAVTFSQLGENNVVTSGDLDFAMEQVETAIHELEHLAVLGGKMESHPQLSLFLSEATAAFGLLEAGQVDAARDHVLTSVEPAYVELSQRLGEEQTAIQAAIDDNTAAGQTVNGWIVFVLTLGVPGAAVATYFVIARRQIKAIEERTRIELRAEREISRAKDAFIAGLSHELRTPLTSIYGFAEILSDGGVHGLEATQETARIIASESAEMTRMVDDLLAASRLDSTGLEIEATTIPLQDVIEAAVAPFERAGQEVSREMSTAVVSTDPARLRHVLVNLLSNSIRHGGPDVALEVSTGENMVDISVIDDGPGVPDDRIENLYERFAHDGSEPLLTGSVGLGLAIASRITQLLGGEIRYQRYHGKTYFVVTIPTESGVGDVEADNSSVTDMIRALSA